MVPRRRRRCKGGTVQLVLVPSNAQVPQSTRLCPTPLVPPKPVKVMVWLLSV